MKNGGIEERKGGRGAPMKEGMKTGMNDWRELIGGRTEGNEYNKEGRKGGRRR